MYSPSPPLLALERRQNSIQQNVQAMLDAQSLGLVQGFVQDASSDAGSSSTPGGAVPVRQPKKKVVGLRGARRGLLRDMQELASIKREEESVLSVEIERRDESLAKVDVWEKRIEGVQSQLNSHNDEEAGENAQEIAELRTEEAAVTNEIQEIEDRLAQMRARKRWLGGRLNEGINRREARLSSYRGALREIESEVNEFLRRPPIPVSVVMGDEESFTTLPASRRTLGMAHDWWTREASQLQLRQEEVRKEHEALEEGAEMWEECVKIVVEFEDGLRKEMSSNAIQGPEMLRSQIERMGQVIQTLSETLQVAEDRGWKLLICAVGAELEAFKEGEGILKDALGAVQGNDGSSHGDESSEANLTNGLEELTGRSETHEDSEDDGPNLAELLIDRGDPEDTS